MSIFAHKMNVNKSEPSCRNLILKSEVVFYEKYIFHSIILFKLLEYFVKKEDLQRNIIITMMYEDYYDEKKSSSVMSCKGELKLEFFLSLNTKNVYNSKINNNLERN